MQSVLTMRISNQNQVLFSHTYNLQYVHVIKSDVTEEIL